MAKTRPPQTKKKLGGPRTGDGGPRQAKVDAVADMKDRFTGSSAVLLTEYRGMKVHELAELRTSLRETGTDYKVYKNTLATIAVRDAGIEGLNDLLEGPTAFAFVTGDPVVAAKKLADFAKRIPTLVLKGGLLDGKPLSAKDAAGLATLESREVMLAKIAGMFQSPIQQLANLMAQPLIQLGSALAQLRDKLHAEADAAPAAEPEAAALSEPEAAAPTDAEPPAAEQPTGEAAPTEETPATEEAPAPETTEEG